MVELSQTRIMILIDDSVLLIWIKRKWSYYLSRRIDKWTKRIDKLIIF